ncbi:thrombospondin type 3 repeat-containing protein [Pontiella sp.]|uniref:thrombospondin type 3 repeat-containing protein n=1 Tax=Pontiella sp. TaxID=2837462 RepID=UPI0035673CEA
MKMHMFITGLTAAATCVAATTIDPANKYGYGANIGWVNAAGDVANGAVIGQAFCSGYLWGANVGWIHLGNGEPPNGKAYGNVSSRDYGINHDGAGRLSGYAYGANIGWINFEQTRGKPMVNLATGDLSGYAWGANVGWINLATLATLTIDPGPSVDGDNIPDAWELGHTNTIWVLNGGDADGDGMPDEAEYLADTDPLDPGDYLRITDFQTLKTTNWVTWPVKTTRLYTLQHAAALSNGMSWATTSSPFIPTSGPGVTETVSGVADTNRFYRVEARPPLSP